MPKPSTLITLLLLQLILSSAKPPLSKNILLGVREKISKSKADNWF
jgi:hypothetical protein